MPVIFQDVLINPKGATNWQVLASDFNVEGMTVFQKALTEEKIEKITETDLSEASASLRKAAEAGSRDFLEKLKEVAESLAALQQKSPEQYERIVTRTMTLGGTGRFGNIEEAVAILRKEFKERQTTDVVKKRGLIFQNPTWAEFALSKAMSRGVINGYVGFALIGPAPYINSTFNGSVHVSEVSNGEVHFQYYWGGSALY